MPEDNAIQMAQTVEALRGENADLRQWLRFFMQIAHGRACACRHCEAARKALEAK